MNKSTSTYDVFVSYAHEDGAFVARLVNALESKNITVWYDQGRLRLGDSMLRLVEDGLENSRFFLLVLSPESVKSPWMQFEAGVALGRAGSRRILPILLKPIDLEKLARFSTLVANNVAIDAQHHSVDEIAAMISSAVQTTEEEGQEAIELSPSGAPD